MSQSTSVSEHGEDPAPRGVAVLGTGAIGGAMAAALGDAGRRVKLCVRTPFERLKRTMPVDGIATTTEYTHEVVTEPRATGAVDWVLLCTKAYQIDGASAWLERLVDDRTRIAVMQNGVDHVERVAGWVDSSRAVPCILLLPAALEAPGHARQAKPGIVQVPDTPASHALQGLFGDQDAARIEIVPDFVSALWSKLVLNAVGGAICSLVLRPLGAMAEPAVQDLARALIEEVVAVGRAEGARFDDDVVERTIAHFSGPIAEHWTSIAVDRREGRALEWDVRNAVVGRIGRRHGIATPMNDAMTALLSIIEPHA
ncbi:MAG: 2-dehydropantoate 2-reductase [Gammaproteobacteria bacterium]|nr:2-dehydropantoate 2-reductase [Gammaproteobacteria bacterium]